MQYHQVCGLALSASRFTVYGSRFTVYGSEFTVHGFGSWFKYGSRFTVLGSRFTVHGSRFTVHGSRFTVHGSRFTVHGSWLRVGADCYACPGVVGTGRTSWRAAKRFPEPPLPHGLKPARSCDAFRVSHTPLPCCVVTVFASDRSGMRSRAWTKVRADVRGRSPVREGHRTCHWSAGDDACVRPDATERGRLVRPRCSGQLGTECPRARVCAREAPPCSRRETLNPETRNPKTDIRNRKPQIPKPQTQTRNRKPSTFSVSG